MSVLSNQPSNPQFLSPVGFNFSIRKLPNVNYFAQSINLPGVQLGETILPTPFIAVPLPHSIDNHQYLNAKYYEQKGCCWILEQRDLSIKNLFNLIKQTIENKNKLQNIRENMKENFNKKVYENVENTIKEFI